MPQLVVRNIEEKVVHKLRLRAAHNGISMEEEHRRILRETLMGRKRSNKTFARHLLTIPKAGKQEPADLFKRRQDQPRKIVL